MRNSRIPSENLDIPRMEQHSYKAKLDELQAKIRKSKLQHRQLENEFQNLMMQRSDCDRSAIRSFRSKYHKLMEEDRRRSDRNDRLKQMLERIDYQAAALAAKTERLKLLKAQYELHLMRYYGPHSGLPIYTIPSPPRSNVSEYENSNLYTKSPFLSNRSSNFEKEPESYRSILKHDKLISEPQQPPYSQTVPIAGSSLGNYLMEQNKKLSELDKNQYNPINSAEDENNPGKFEYDNLGYREKFVEFNSRPNQNEIEIPENVYKNPAKKFVEFEPGISREYNKNTDISRNYSRPTEPPKKYNEYFELKNVGNLNNEQEKYDKEKAEKFALPEKQSYESKENRYDEINYRNTVIPDITENIYKNIPNTPLKLPISSDNINYNNSAESVTLNAQNIQEKKSEMLPSAENATSSYKISMETQQKSVINNIEPQNDKINEGQTINNNESKFYSNMPQLASLDEEKYPDYSNFSMPLPVVQTSSSYQKTVDIKPPNIVNNIHQVWEKVVDEEEIIHAQPIPDIQPGVYAPVYRDQPKITEMNTVNNYKQASPEPEISFTDQVEKQNTESREDVLESIYKGISKLGDTSKDESSDIIGKIEDVYYGEKILPNENLQIENASEIKESINQEIKPGSYQTEEVSNKLMSENQFKMEENDLTETSEYDNPAIEQVQEMNYEENSVQNYQEYNEDLQSNQNINYQNENVQYPIEPVIQYDEQGVSYYPNENYQNKNEYDANNLQDYSQMESYPQEQQQNYNENISDNNSQQQYQNPSYYGNESEQQQYFNNGEVYQENQDNSQNQQITDPNQSSVIEDSSNYEEYNYQQPNIDQPTLETNYNQQQPSENFYNEQDPQQAQSYYAEDNQNYYQDYQTTADPQSNQEIQQKQKAEITLTETYISAKNDIPAPPQEQSVTNEPENIETSVVTKNDDESTTTSTTYSEDQPIIPQPLLKNTAADEPDLVTSTPTVAVEPVKKKRVNFLDSESEQSSSKSSSKPKQQDDSDFDFSAN